MKYHQVYTPIIQSLTTIESTSITLDIMKTDLAIWNELFIKLAKELQIWDLVEPKLSKYIGNVRKIHDGISKDETKCLDVKEYDAMMEKDGTDLRECFKGKCKWTVPLCFLCRVERNYERSKEIYIPFARAKIHGFMYQVETLSVYGSEQGEK